MTGLTCVALNPNLLPLWICLQPGFHWFVQGVWEKCLVILSFLRFGVAHLWDWNFWLISLEKYLIQSTRASLVWIPGPWHHANVTYIRCVHWIVMSRRNGPWKMDLKEMTFLASLIWIIFRYDIPELVTEVDITLKCFHVIYFYPLFISWMRDKTRSYR